MNTHLGNAFADGSAVAEVSKYRTGKSRQDSGLCFLVGQLGQPLIEPDDRSKVFKAVLLYPTGYLRQERIFPAPPTRRWQGIPIAITMLAVPNMVQPNNFPSIRHSLTIILFLTLIGVPLFSQSPPVPKPAARPTPPTRDPHTPGYVAAKELPDGAVPPANEDGNFILGPTHPAAPDNPGQNLANGTVIEFTMNSSDSKIYPGIAREAGTFGTPDPADPAKLVVTTSHPAPYTRKVAVYVPKQYVAGALRLSSLAPTGLTGCCFRRLDSLIAQHKLPVMIAISIGNGSGDAQGSERGLEYDTMSGVYAEFVEKEVLPLVEVQAHVKLTKDPDGRATMGGSSGGSCALIMAWYHPELYHRVLTYSGTFINQQWPSNPRNPARRLGIS